MHRFPLRRRAARRLAGCVAAALTLLCLAVPSQPAVAAPPTLTGEVLQTGLSFPWDIGFTPDGAMLFTERSPVPKINVKLPGANGQIDAADPSQTLAANLAPVFVGRNAFEDAGLLGLAVDPDFATTRAIFTCQTELNANVYDVRVTRWTIDAGYTTATRAGNVITGIPTISGDGKYRGSHSGCRPRFGADGHLYVSTGDAGDGVNAQSPTRLGGKVLRVDEDTGLGVPGNPGIQWLSDQPGTFEPDSPTASIDYAGQYHVFGAGPGPSLRHVFWDGRGWITEDMDVRVSIGTSVAVTNYGGQLQVFADAFQDGIRHLWWDPVLGRWFSETLDPVGSTGVGLSTTVYTFNGQIQVFGDSTGLGVRHGWYDPVAAQWGFETLDEPAASGASTSALTFNANANLQVFSDGGGNGVRHGWFDPFVGFWRFETLDGAGSSGAALPSTNLGAQLQIFGTPAAAGGGARHLWYDPAAGSWLAETLDKPNSAGTGLSTIVFATNGQIQLFGEPSAGNPGIRHVWYDPFAVRWIGETVGAAPGPAGETSTIHYGGQLHVMGTSDTALVHAWHVPGPALDSRILSWGHHNPQGLALRPGTGRMYSAEHGPNIDDEVNLESPGNMGWNPRPPDGSAGYYEAVPMTDLVKYPDAVRPVWTSGNQTFATSGTTFVTGAAWGDFNGSLVVACLKTQQLLFLRLNSEGTAVAGQTSVPSSVLVPSIGPIRLRTPVQGPDGKLYVTTSRSTNTNPGQDVIFRVTPS